MDAIEKGIKEKVEAIGTPLSEWDINIFRGILTGLNAAFIISGQKKDELIAQDPKSAEIIRPILRGRDIKRYSYYFSDLYVITTFPSLRIDIEDYPSVKKHLLSFDIRRLEQSGSEFLDKGKKVKSRKKTLNKWYETQDTIAYWEDFLSQKIIYSEIVRSPKFYLDTSAFFVEATAFIMSGIHLPFLTVMLNSKLYAFAFKHFYSGGGLGEDGYRYKKAFLLNLPVIIPDQEFETEVIDLLNEMTSKQDEDLQQLDYFIEELIMSAHSFSKEEKKLIHSISFTE